ncbi:MAG: alpha/beta hydrolase, partial [Eubacteriales bacterium]
MDGQNKWKGHLKKCLLISGVFLLVSGIGFAFYVSDYYRSDPVAIETLEQENVEVLGDFTVILPEKPGNSAVIFYPGGKVEHSAYLPLLEEISQHGITCILAKMPFNLAVFDIYKADGILGTMPEIEYWFLAGHSLGGIMASVAAEHNTLVHGLILLGSYLYSDFPVEKTL